MLPTLLSTRYVFAGSIFSCRATTSGSPFSAVVFAPLQSHMMVFAFRATRRVLEELEKGRSSCKRNASFGMHNVVRRRIQDNIAYSSPFLSLFML